MIRLTIALLLFALPASAKDLYVAPTGSDTVTYAQNGPAAPWRSIGRAAWGSASRSAPNASEAARAGDTVHVAAGPYATAGTNVRFDPAYNPVNEGTESAPIVFQAEGTVTLTLSSSIGPVIGTNGRDWITWRGFTIHEATAPSRADTGPVVLWNAVGAVADGLSIDCNGDPGYGDNHTGIRLEHAQQAIVRNNVIRNCRTSGVNGQNGAGIMTYTSGNYMIEHNEITDSGSGIFLKQHGTPGEMQYVDQGAVQFNLLRRNVFGLAVNRVPTTAARPTRITQNIIEQSGQAAIRIINWTNDGSAPTNIWITNNTFRANPTATLYLNGDLTANAGIRFTSNIVTDSGAAVFWQSGGASLNPATLLFAGNVYHPAVRLMSGGWNYATLAAFMAAGQDQGSIAADPLFVSATDLRLRPESPARGLLAGAYLTGAEVIGVTTGPTPPPDPPPPPTPQDCVLSAWSAPVAGPWGACVGGVQTRTEARTRSILLPPGPGGLACGPLTETTLTERLCSVEPPPPPVVPCPLLSGMTSEAIRGQTRVALSTGTSATLTARLAAAIDAGWTPQGSPTSTQFLAMRAVGDVCAP